MVRWIWLILAAAVITAAVVVSSDRNSDDEAKIRTVVRAYAAASATGDEQRLCALMTSASRDQFAATSARPEQGCEGAIRALDADLEAADYDAYRKLAATRVVIDDATAEVESVAVPRRAGRLIVVRWLAIPRTSPRPNGPSRITPRT